VKWLVPMMKPCFYKFFSDVMTWQRATFGDIDSRSPVGACNHLIKEIQTEMLPEALLTGKVPLKEVVDGYVLMSEIAWRSGYTAQDILTAAQDKLHNELINRTYPKPVGNEISEHVR
jgi:hypothetical protein